MFLKRKFNKKYVNHIIFVHLKSAKGFKQMQGISRLMTTRYCLTVMEYHTFQQVLRGLTFELIFFLHTVDRSCAFSYNVTFSLTYEELLISESMSTYSIYFNTDSLFNKLLYMYVKLFTCVRIFYRIFAKLFV